MVPFFLESTIQQMFIHNGWTLSLAESCTGGALAARLSRQPGCSQYFLGSIVTYSNQLKIKLLGVDEQAILQHGAVSEAVVKKMAEGVLCLTGSDYSLAVSGIAGPSGGTVSKPVGTIWSAIAQKDQPTQAHLFQLSGNREEIIQKSIDLLLNELCLLIKNPKSMYG